MSDAELWAAWRVWMGVATVVVLIAASLLIVIWLTARKILADAVRVIAAAQAIRQQTQPVWALETTNMVAEDILANVQAFENKATLLAQALTRTEALK